MQEALEGQTLGHYQLQRSIGRGGMAEVYLAYDEHLHREIAVKIVRRGRTDDLARFRHEAEMLALLTHEHILPVYDYSQQGPWHYLVMPYISHGTLADHLQTRGPLTMEEAGTLLDQIASALQYAHDRGILHRDIKPSNILLRDDAFAYLADFGIARLLERESGLTQTGSFIGTPEYMAPELFESQASQSSDIYALGIVLYSLLTGRLPFTGPNPLTIVQKQLHEPPTPPSRLNRAVSPEVEQVVLCALEKDPRRRFQSARAFANVYRHALQAPALFTTQPAGATSGFYADPTLAVRPAPFTPPGFRPSSRPAVPARFTRRRRTLSLIALGLFVLLLVLVGSLVATLSLWNHAGGQPSASSTVTAPAPTSTLMPTATQPAPTCVVNDAAGVLDQNQVCQAARSLPYSLVVNTSSVPGGNGDSSSSPQSIDAHTIVINIVIDRHHGHEQTQAQVTITGGSSVSLTSDQYQKAEDAFNQAAQAGDYTAATMGALQSLQENSA
jgi:tRNA A-37 threonylcarbamoyl transferase component Bud32